MTCVISYLKLDCMMEEKSNSLLVSRLLLVNACFSTTSFREKGEMEVCEIANFLFCGVRVIGASETCMRYLEDNQKSYNFTVYIKYCVFFYPSFLLASESVYSQSTVVKPSSQYTTGFTLLF